MWYGQFFQGSPWAHPVWFLGPKCGHDAWTLLRMEKLEIQKQWDKTFILLLSFVFWYGLRTKIHQKWTLWHFFDGRWFPAGNTIYNVTRYVTRRSARNMLQKTGDWSLGLFLRLCTVGAYINESFESFNFPVTFSINNTLVIILKPRIRIRE